MALPKINNTPKYSITIPSSKKEVRFRPFLVREEKILLMAFESKDTDQILSSIVDTVVACIDEDINKNQLMPFDIEYLFLKIRAKSVGEKIDLSLNCSSCEAPNNVSVDLDEIKVDVSSIPDTITINEKIKIKMKWPHYGSLIKAPKGVQLNSVDQSLYTIANCIDSVLTEDEAIKISDEPIKEVIDFIESLNSSQFAKVQDFVKAMPQLSHSLEFTCKCGHHNKVELKGLQDFF